MISETRALAQEMSAKRTFTFKYCAILNIPVIRFNNMPLICFTNTIDCKTKRKQIKNKNIVDKTKNKNDI